MADDQAPAHVPVAVLIGAVTISWNGAQETILKLFHRVSGMPKPMAEAVFFSLRSDSSQRDITRAVCMNSADMPLEWKQDVANLISELDRKAGERNAAIHTIWDGDALFKGTVQPSSFVDPLYYSKKLQPNVVDQFKALLVEIMKTNAKLHLCLKQWETAQSLRHGAQSPPPATKSME